MLSMSVSSICFASWRWNCARFSKVAFNCLSVAMAARDSNSTALLKHSGTVVMGIGLAFQAILRLSASNCEASEAGVLTNANRPAAPERSGPEKSCTPRLFQDAAARFGTGAADRMSAAGSVGASGLPTNFARAYVDLTMARDQAAIRRALFSIGEQQRLRFAELDYPSPSLLRKQAWSWTIGLQGLRADGRG